MLGLNTAELVIILVIVLLIFGWTQFKNISGPSNGPKPGFEFHTNRRARFRRCSLP